MIIISIDRLKAKMVAAETIPAADPAAAPLVTASTVLDDEIIKRLRQRNLPAMAVELPQTQHLDILAVSSNTTNVYNKLKGLLSNYFSLSEPIIDVNEYTRLSSICSSMVSNLVRDRSNGCKAFVLPLAAGDTSLEKHSANVAYLCLATALNVESFMVEERRSANALAACDITNLAVGAALHDIGKIKIPSTLDIHQPSEIKPSRSYIQHTLAGPNMISQRVSPTARSIVRHHHQHFDGSGFPDMAMVTSKRKQGSLSDRGIHIFSRIATICDHFDNLLSPEMPIALPAMIELLNPKWTARFDPYILWSFASMMPAMPIASHIVLADGTNAIVAAHNPKSPCQPDLLVLDSAWKPSKTLKASELGGSYPKIAKCLDRDISGLSYQIPPEPKDNTAITEIAQSLDPHAGVGVR